MTTVKDLISNSMKLLAALAAGEAATADEAADGLAFLNMLVDSLSNRRLIIYTINRDLYTFVSNQQTYTLGPGGDWDADRPVRIESMSVMLATAAPTEIPIEMLRDEEWQNVTVKSTPSSFPLMVYDDGAFPLRNLSFWPIPTQTDQAVIYSYSAISSFGSVNDTLSLPKGYERFLTYALALEMAPSFNREPSPTLMSNYTEAKRVLEVMNWTPNEMMCDPALLIRSAGSIAAKSRGYVVD